MKFLERTPSAKFNKINHVAFRHVRSRFSEHALGLRLCVLLCSVACGCVVDEVNLNSDAGTAGSGGSGGTGGAVAMGCGTCPNDRPVCDESGEEPQCVECNSEDDSACTAPSSICDTSRTPPACVECTMDNTEACANETPMCDTSTGRCSSCLLDSDCSMPDAAKCVEGRCASCDAEPQCDGIFANVSICRLGMCVECTAENTSACVNNTICDTSRNRCVQCLQDGDCDQANSARCELSVGECVSCDDSVQCAGIFNDNICQNGVCLPCLPGRENGCGDNSCNPSTLQCTGTRRGSVRVCEPCVADSECGDGTSESDNFRCIAVEFNGVPQGGRCFQRRDPSCPKPYGHVISRTSVSGAPMDSYCAIREDLTTCEAVRAAVRAATCSGGDPSPCAPDGALCKTIATVSDQCTYPCSADIQCPEGKPACNGEFCTSIL